MPRISSLLWVIPVIIAVGLGKVTWDRKKVGPDGYGFSSTAKQVADGIDLVGKVAIVTGATAGLGLETSMTLARQGATVIMAGRTNERLEKAKSQIETALSLENIDAKLVPMVLDLSSIASIENFSAKFKKLNLPLHFLINNAGIMALPSRELTEDGFEMQMGTNHLGHFHLTNLLTNKLKQSAPSRVVIVSSLAHSFADLSFIQDSQLESSKYSSFVSYGNSKLANVLHAAELDRRLSSSGVRVFSLHPGMIPTELDRHLVPWMKYLGFFLRPLLAVTLFKTIPQGASTQVFAALRANESDGGKYFDNCQLGKVLPSTGVLDQQNLARLWETSSNLIQEAQKRKN